MAVIASPLPPLRRSRAEDAAAAARPRRAPPPRLASARGVCDVRGARSMRISGTYVLLPAIPATLLLYAIARLVLARIAHRRRRAHAWSSSGSSSPSRRPSCRSSTRTSRSRLSPRSAPRRTALFYCSAPTSRAATCCRAPSGAASASSSGASPRRLRRLCGRHDVRAARRLSRRLVGPGDLVPRQHPPVLPGDGAVHPDPELSRRRAASTSSSPSPSPRRPPIMRIVRGLALRHEDPRLHLRGPDARRAPAAHHDLSSSCRTRAGRSSSMPACGSATPRSPSPP